MQYHENIRMEDPDRFFAPNGPLEALLEAKKAGKIRYIGFTGHKDPAVHLRMLEVAAQHNFHFDTAQMPLNILDAQFRSFAPPGGAEAGGAGDRAAGDEADGERCDSAEQHRNGDRVPALCAEPADVGGDQRLRQSMERLDQAFEAARTFKPLTQAQIDTLAAKTREAALTGKYELFKTSTQFDGTAQHPEWMG